jgi:UDP-glucuronate 4-epimerase
MKILVTGACGFIGFNLCQNLLNDKSNRIIGVDIIDNYYSTKLKFERLKILNKNKNFKFYKIDITKKKNLKKLFIKFKFEKIIHLAAQAGVRYSVQNPEKYINYNVLGFFNILELIRVFNKKSSLIYASSSSVYGENKNYPINENNYLFPKNIYGLTKKFNEEMAENYARNYSLKIIGIRFFTVFGEWGRPDMFIIKYLIAFFKNKIFYLNNKGNHYRDFTYIKDAVQIIRIIIKSKNSIGHKIYNICSNNPISLKTVIKFFKRKNIKPKIVMRNLQAADILKTHGDNKFVVKETKFKRFTKPNIALENTLNWFLNNKDKF